MVSGVKVDAFKPKEGVKIAANDSEAQSMAQSETNGIYFFFCFFVLFITFQQLILNLQILNYFTQFAVWFDMLKIYFLLRMKMDQNKLNCLFFIKETI